MAVRTILVAHDFSPHAEAALDWAIGAARAFDAALHLVHVVHPQLEVLSPYDLHLPEPIVRELENESQQRLQASLDRLRGHGLEAKVHVVQGSPAEGVAATAEQIGADLVVTGTRGNTGLKHVVFGSVAERIHRLTPGAVVSVKADDA